jgi:hypothetical protein
MRRIAVFLSVIALTACVQAPVTQLYPGPTLATSQHVLVRVDQPGRAFTSERVDIQQVDDKATLSTGEGIFSSASGASAVYVLPGKHTLRLRYRGPGAAVTANLWFVGEAGNSYVVKAGQTGDGLKVWIEDEKTGKPVGGTRGSADEPK